MKGFGSAGGRSVHQIVLQHATQEIIHQVGEDDVANSIQMSHDQKKGTV